MVNWDEASPTVQRKMTEHALVSPHDAIGTNLYGHVLRGRLLRVVPRANEAINETWIADRDRFSYEGLYAADRLARPLMKRDGEWHEVDWGARGADLFLCECTHAEGGAGGHLSLAELKARRPGIAARRIILTHLGPAFDGRRMAGGFALARDGMRIRV